MYTSCLYDDIFGLDQVVAINTKYPEYAKNNNISGEVFIEFEVDSLGFVNDICVLKGVHPSLDIAAYRAIQLLHQFKYPGIRDGKIDNITLRTPIRFVLH